jgi:glutamate synthase domain-containing protein 2
MLATEALLLAMLPGEPAAFRLLVFQIGRAKYGEREAQGTLDDNKSREVAAHTQVKMFELKLSQGAKPGKGGILPAVKVTEEIARIRGIPAYMDSISPNRHPEIKDEGGLLDVIAHIREIGGKPAGFKTVVGAYGWLDDLFAEIKRRGLEHAPDFITIDSADGGTGAAPTSLIDYMGLRVRKSLPMVVDKLEDYGLKDRIKVIASGKLITPAEVAWAMCVGADSVVSARGFMFALGCIRAMQCNRNTCPTGITTHNPKFQKGLDAESKAVRVMHFVKNIVYEVGVIAHSCGVAEPRLLRRSHARLVTANGGSRSLEEVYRRGEAPRLVFEPTSQQSRGA